MWRKSGLLIMGTSFLVCATVLLLVVPDVKGAKLYSSSGGVTIIDTTTNTVDTTILPPLFLETLPPSSNGRFQAVTESSLALNQRTAYFATTNPTLAQRGIVTFDTATNTFGTWYPMPYRRVGKVGVTADLSTMFAVDRGCAIDDPCVDPWGSGFVHVVDLATGTVITSIPIPEQSFDGVMSPDGMKFYVPHRDAGYVSVIDTVTRTIVKTIPAARGAHDIVISSDGTRGYVTNEGSDSVSCLDLTNEIPLATVSVESHPIGIALSSDDRTVYVGNRDSASLSVIDAASCTVLYTVPNAVPGAKPKTLAFSASDRLLYVGVHARPAIGVYDTTTLPIKLIKVIELTTETAATPFIVSSSQALSASLTSLSFDQVAVNSSQDLSFAVTNRGSSTLSVNVTSPASPFSLVSTDSFALDGGATQTLTVRFSPTSAGSFGGVIKITSSEGTLTILVSGIGIVAQGPALAVCSTALDFGEVVIGSSKDLTCVVTNTGTGTLTGTAFTSPPFTLVSGGSFTLAPNQSQALQLQLIPSAIGVLQGSLSLESNGGSTTIALNGIGTQGSVLAVSPTTLNFGGVRVGRAKELTLTVQNTGDVPLQRHICIADPFTSSEPLFALAAGQSQTLRVSFSPPNLDRFTGAVLFSAGDCSGGLDPVVVLMSGTGEPEGASGRAFVANRDSHTVSVINTASQQQVATIPVGQQPVALALTPNEGKVYVANSASQNISVINTATLRVDATIQLGLNPLAIAVSPDGQVAYAANGDLGPDSNPGGGSLSVISSRPDTLVATLPVPRPAPSVLTFSPNGRVLYVLGSGSRFVAVVDTQTKQVARIEAEDDPVAIAFSPQAGGRAYIANQGGNSVSVFDTTTFPPSKLTDVPVGQEPRSLVVSPDGTKVYVASFRDDSIWRIDTFTNQAELIAQCVPPALLASAPQLQQQAVQSSFFAPWCGPWDIDITPDGNKVIVINKNSNNVGLVNAATDQFEATVPVGTAPAAKAFDPELPQAIVINSGSNDVSFVNTTNGTASSLPVGQTPVAVVTTLQPPGSLRLSDIMATLESPEAGSVSGITVIRGWAFSLQAGEQISSVELFIDDVPSGNLPCCSERADIQTTFPQFPAQNTLNSGWGGVFNWGALGTGPHTVRVEIRSAMGRLLWTGKRLITVVNPGGFEFLDRFSLANATAKTVGDELVVEGIVVRDKASQQQKTINARFRWSTSSQSVQMIETVTTAMASSFPTFFAKVFTSFLTRFTGLPAPAGVQAALGIEQFFESPEENQAVSGVALVRGWAFPEAQGASLNEIRLVIDGMPSSLIPCCSQRSDVAANYPGNPHTSSSGCYLNS
ncbi:MAG TPA: choice-of-anchor D domain-containing protein [Candidatus Binatia bacterium]|nr:choice-of-anchor D domain-containing protein [Candidatus Binatia bacterium]